jgi:hypothetical protein
VLVLVSGHRDWLFRLGPDEQAFYLRTEAESSPRNDILNKNKIMSKNTTIVLIYHHHELLDL